MSYTQISLDVVGSTATITLDRPDKLNAYTVTMFEELLDAYDRTDADDAVRAVVLTGRGRAFCAGADLGDDGAATFAKGGLNTGGGVRDSGGHLAVRMFNSRKPIIAAINGHAVGVGLTMTLPADIRLVAVGAKLSFPFLGRGIVTDGAASWFLPRVVGISQAVEWCMTARMFGPDEALGARLVRSVHDPVDVLPEAYRLADEIAAGSAPVSALVTRQLLWRGLGASHPMWNHEVESRAITDLGRGPDSAEGVGAFLEKRRPEWKMTPSHDLPDWFPFYEEPTYRELGEG